MGRIGSIACVAILGRGIAVVEQLSEKEVCVLLWNRKHLRIRRKEIVWDDGNARWEANRVHASSKLENP